MKSFLEGGGSILVALGEGGENKYGTNINYFLEEFGMMVNSDSVVSTVFRGTSDKEASFVHPKVSWRHSVFVVHLLNLCGTGGACN